VGEAGGDSEGGSAADSEPPDLDVDPGLIREMAANLDRADVTLLSAIRDINEHPEDYPDGATSRGKVPANASTIKDSTGLTKYKVDYRLTPGKRGLEDMGPGLVRLLAPKYLPSGGMGARSAELTDLGRAVLSVAEGEEGIGDVSPHAPSAIDREEFAALRQQVTEWRESKAGALDDELAEGIDSLFDTMVMFYQAFEALGIDPEETFTGEVTPEDQEQIAEAVTTTVLERLAERDGVNLGADVVTGAGAPAGGSATGGSAESAAPSGWSADGGEPGDPMGGGSEGSEGGEDGDSRGLDEFGDGGGGR
jgi:hypothetical protein